MATLAETIGARENDYGPLAERYRAATGGDLVADPLRSHRHAPQRLTRTASVLIGTYNSLSSLMPALVSLAHSSLNRRHPDLLEVIVVDDGSTDGTREAVLDLRLDLRLIYVRQRRGGLTQAHNTGLAHAQGDIVIFSDSDIVHLPYALEELIKRHQVLPHVTLAGFRFSVAASDDRLAPAALPGALEAQVPRFWLDHRLRYPGWPANVCRETGHWRRFGRGRRVQMGNGALFELEGMVVGALCSLERADLLRLGGSEERMCGYGAEDTLIAARSFALGNPIIPVYSAVGWHVAHPRRDAGEEAELRRNRHTLAEIYAEPLAFPEPDLARWRARALEVVELARAKRGAPEPPEYLPPPQSAAAAGQWGRAALAVGRFREALEHFDAAAEMAPAPAAALGRAHSLLGLGDGAKAHAAATDALALGAPEPAARWALALARARQGDYGASHELLRASAAAGAPDGEAAWALGTAAEEHKARGNFHAEQGLHEIAVADFDFALMADPRYEWAHFDRGVSLRALGWEREALWSVRRALELLHPEDGHQTWVHLMLGELYLCLGGQRRARVELERALGFDPGNERARAALGQVVDAADVNGWLAPRAVPASVEEIPGWLSLPEARLLSGAAAQASGAGAAGRRSVIVEIGSFCGRSTVAIAAGLSSPRDGACRFLAVDPHEGYHLGDGGDTQPALMANLRRHGLTDRVTVVRARSHELLLDDSVGLLFVDGSHEYEDVRRDYEHFRDHLVPGALVAFHDYDPCCPGVQRLVNELLDAGELEVVGREGMLIVLAHPAQPSRVSAIRDAP